MSILHSVIKRKKKVNENAKLRKNVVSITCNLLSLLLIVNYHNDNGQNRFVRMPSIFRMVFVEGVPLAKGLSDPELQPIFMEIAPNALDPSYIRQPNIGKDNEYTVPIGYSEDHYTGLRYNNIKVPTKIFGYGSSSSTNEAQFLWPGLTFVIQNFKSGGAETTRVTYSNDIPVGMNHILPFDPTIHWAYSDTNSTIEKNGVPVIPHLHGGITDFQFDGHPEAYFTSEYNIIGPFWNRTPTGFTPTFVYDNNQDAAPLWIHDHTLGMTRLNVYAGMTCFYFIRDQYDAGDATNPYGLPYGEHELAYIIQDRMFKETGDLFFPSKIGDPTYSEYITDEGITLPTDMFPSNGGPTAFPEFFGDHMVVNGIIWPKVNVEPTEYRIRLLNGCDSRFLIIQFVILDNMNETDTKNITSSLPFTVIGSGSGLGTPKIFQSNQPLVIEPSSRYDIIVDFSTVSGKRIILQNLGTDSPFGEVIGNNDIDDLFPKRRTDRIMAFDASSNNNIQHVPQFNLLSLPKRQVIRNIRKKNRHLVLMEGSDEYGRIQPLLGAATTKNNDPRGLFAAYTWIQKTTENPRYLSIEDWYFINLTEDSHSMHVHLAQFDVIGDFTFTYTSNGTQDVIQHMGGIGIAPKITSMSKFEMILKNTTEYDNYYSGSLKDMVTVRPGNPSELIGRGTIIRLKFLKKGIYEWHCHILSHEDHEMMREFSVS